ncbi:hypothetical protein BDB01DRAFT_795385 [Pilobolus umbonatus]|nr:hypothetical protein BDB01DRAFT_795385 [Pilobolus umbonatus]
MLINNQVKGVQVQVSIFMDSFIPFLYNTHTIPFLATYIHSHALTVDSLYHMVKYVINLYSISLLIIIFYNTMFYYLVKIRHIFQFGYLTVYITIIVYMYI